MDRRVKERLVGATILVALIVVIVPELLSGPKPPVPPPLAAGTPNSDTMRSLQIDFTTNKATAEPDHADETDGGAASAGAAAPAPAAEATSAPLTVTTLKAQDAPAAPAVETQTSSPTSKLPAAAPGSPVPSQSHRAWAVQLGSFASKVNADKLMHQLKSAGAPVYLLTGGSRASVRYRVRVGPLADRIAAERELAKLQAAGHPATLVTPDS